MKMNKYFFIVFVVFFTLSSGNVFAAGKSGPTEQLKPVMNDLLQVLADEGLKGEHHFVERRAKIMKIISLVFDFREMSKRILGKTWRKLSDDDRDNFTRLMTKLLENVYVGKLETYSGQTIDFDGERVKGHRAQVTTLVEDGGHIIPIHYIMRERGSRWFVYDINIEGVGLVKNYHEQFKSILRKEKYKGLVKVLEEKNRSFARPAKGQATETDKNQDRKNNKNRTVEQGKE